MELAIAGKGGNDTTQLAARSRFTKFDPEKEQASRKVDVKEDKVLLELKKAWNSCGYRGGYSFFNGYGNILDTVSKLDYSSKDVEKFSIALAEFQDEDMFSNKAGLFLSALVETSKDVDFVIHTKHLTIDIASLGYENTKNIIVEGNVGINVGGGMRGGSITVKGNAENNVGLWMNGGSIVIEGNARHDVGSEMKNGTIVIRGDAGNHVGNEMQGGSIMVKGDVGLCLGKSMKEGKITVQGTVGYRLGEDMEGGEIHFQGDSESISYYVYGGKIYHKGKLIRP